MSHVVLTQLAQFEGGFRDFAHREMNRIKRLDFGLG